MADAIGLTLGFIVFFLDFIVFCIFLSRVRVSFNKQIIDDDWQSANDYWLKLSRLSGLMFSIFHIGTMIIIIAECTQMDNNILHNNGIAHIYWLLQSLWLFNVNSAIVSITMRCYRVYKTTRTKFTPLKDWIATNTNAIEYLIWCIFICITLFIIIQYLIIITSAPNQYFDIELSIINALRNFGTAAILSFQLIIACFFFYIAHKSQQQTNWNEQSKAIILKETAKLAFIVIFLAIIIGIIFYSAIWYLVNINNQIALNAPFNDTKHRVFWSLLEFLAFWLILYLTRLRKPPSDNDIDTSSMPSTTKTKQFLRRALSTNRDRQKALKEQKQKELEARKKAFRERERKRVRRHVHKHQPMRTADNTFNTLLIKRVALHEREKKLKLQLMLEIKQKNQEKKMESIHKQLKERDRTHTYNQSDPNIARIHLKPLDVLKEDDHKYDTHDTEDEVHISMDDDSPLEPIPHSPHSPHSALKLDIETSALSDSEAPIPMPTDLNELELPKISMPMLLTSPSLPYALTPKEEQKSNHVAVVLTPHRDKLSSMPTSWNFKPDISSELEDTDIDMETDDDMVLTEDEEDDLWTPLPNIENRKRESNVIGLKSIMAKIGSVFTPRQTPNQWKTTNNNTMFPDVDVDTETNDVDVDVDTEKNKQSNLLRSKRSRANTNTMNGFKPKTTIMFPVDDEKEHTEPLQEIVDIYLDAFQSKSGKKSRDKSDRETPTNAKRISDITQFGDGMFHNMVHLKPMLLKRSHSDPDIRTRDHIWDQLLCAFIDNDKNAPSGSLRGSRRGSIQDTSDYYYGSRHASLASRDGDERETSNQSRTQLSLTDRDRGFNHLFGWFNPNMDVTTPTLQEEQEDIYLNVVAMNAKKDKKRSSLKKGKKKKREVMRDSLKLPESPVPDDIATKVSKIQPLTVKIKGNTIQNSDNHRTPRSRSHHSRTPMMTADIMRVTNFDKKDTDEITPNTSTAKLKSHKKKKLKKKKVRITQKKQTKQWMDNVRQVF